MPDVITKIQHRRDTSSNWTANNPTPYEGELCIELDTSRAKVGDGINSWTALPYVDSTLSDADIGAMGYIKVDTDTQLTDTDIIAMGFIQNDGVLFQVGSAGINSDGIITGSSFAGDGSGLTGVLTSSDIGSTVLAPDGDGSQLTGIASGGGASSIDDLTDAMTIDLSSTLRMGETGAIGGANTTLGIGAGSSLNTGSMNNTIVGSGAYETGLGTGNTIIGAYSGVGSSGSYNIFLGGNTFKDYSEPGTDNNNIIIGRDSGTDYINLGGAFLYGAHEIRLNTDGYGANSNSTDFVLDAMRLTMGVPILGTEFIGTHIGDHVGDGSMLTNLPSSGNTLITSQPLDFLRMDITTGATFFRMTLFGNNYDGLSIVYDPINIGPYKFTTYMDIQGTNSVPTPDMGAPLPNIDITGFPDSMGVKLWLNAGAGTGSLDLGFAQPGSVIIWDWETTDGFNWYITGRGEVHEEII